MPVNTFAILKRCEDKKYLEERPTGGQRQTDETLPVDGDDAVADVELATARCGACGMHVGEHSGGENAAPARINYHHAKRLASRLGDYHLCTPAGRRRS